MHIVAPSNLLNNYDFYKSTASVNKFAFRIKTVMAIKTIIVISVVRHVILLCVLLGKRIQCKRHDYLSKLNF